jgi:hypothetical protein
METETDTATTTKLVTKTVTAQATCTAAPSTFQLDMTGGLFAETALSVGIFGGSQFPVFSPFIIAPQAIAALSLDSSGHLFIVDTSGALVLQFKQPTFLFNNDPSYRSLQSADGKGKLVAYCPLPSVDEIGLILASSLSSFGGCQFMSVQA